MSRQLCVFCGEKPPVKNKEHVLPMWLLELTGDPNRVVKFGIDYKNNKVVEFAFDQLVAPACKDCNSIYGEVLEGRVKPIIGAILRREAVSASNYLLLLDWLDKVRIGLWLNYQLIQNMPFGVKPHFRINDRIGRKDRMLAVYAIENQIKGLNAFATETPLFHHTPSCFGLRINDVIIFNMSSDFLFAKKCGFPSPKKRNFRIDGEGAGMLELSDFSTSHKIQKRLISRKILKPCVHLYQPIMQEDFYNQYQGGFLGANWVFNSFIAEHTFDLDKGQGVLFRQFDNRVDVIDDLNLPIEFDEVTGNDCSSVKEIVSQIYAFQIYIQKLNTIKASSIKARKWGREVTKTLEAYNLEAIKGLKAM